MSQDAQRKDFAWVNDKGVVSMILYGERKSTLWELIGFFLLLRDFTTKLAILFSTILLQVLWLFKDLLLSIYIFKKNLKEMSRKSQCLLLSRQYFFS